MSDTTLYFTVNEVRYRWEGGFGAIFKSFEDGVCAGDCRFINHEIFYAYTVYPGGFRKFDTVCWVTAREIDAEGIRDLRKKLFGE